ncbi:MAG: hypothetical protein QF819_10065 [Gemmatimonadota bacterium]|nr:hypothetical protein [Gemmatimonadota bacterium]MDP6803493.1 hypothetical protein [Gemmatimonadota bacterium]MDP7031702.1 hypothetical protein [Gemmatimonadota bacterium]
MRRFIRTRAFRPTQTLLPALGLLVAFAAPGVLAEEVGWTLYPPTGDVAEILISGDTAWIGAGGGVIQADLTDIVSGELTQTRITDDDGLVSPEITAMAFDGLGNVWVGTRDAGISIFDPQGRHLRNINSFEALWSDLVIGMSSEGNRMFVTCADDYSETGTIEGGGFTVIEVEGTESGGIDISVVGIGVPLAVCREVLALPGETWFGSSANGLWRRDEILGLAPEEVLTTDEGLLSDNVTGLARGPHPDLGGQEVLWIGTAMGLQYWDGAALDTVVTFQDHPVHDLEFDGSSLHVIVEDPASVMEREIFSMNLLSSPLTPIQVDAVACLPDTAYLPREVAMSAAGNMVLGTKTAGYSVHDGVTWVCPRPLGPHSPQVADLALGTDGTLYFGTGTKEPPKKGRGVGLFSDGIWGVLSRQDGLIQELITEAVAWPDGTIWFGSSVSKDVGGVSRYFPDQGTFVNYHNTSSDPSHVTLGKNVATLELDAAGNLWIGYGQLDGGVTVIEYPSLSITNYHVVDFTDAGNDLITDLDFDSRGRMWITTKNTELKPGQLYVFDFGGTPSDPTDDLPATSMNVANEIHDLGTVHDIEIDASDRIWLAGEKGLVRGEMLPDLASEARADWTIMNPTSSQSGGRNPLPYLVAALDWSDNLWLGMETSGLVRVSSDGSQWTWFDEIAGEPLPDQAVTGLYMDLASREVYVGTKSSGIAVMAMSVTATGSGRVRSSRPFPNPWRLETDGALQFQGIPAGDVVTMKVFTPSGEVVQVFEELSGVKSWDGRNRNGSRVKAGVYIITAEGVDGVVYEGKVAVLR